MVGGRENLKEGERSVQRDYIIECFLKEECGL